MRAMLGDEGWSGEPIPDLRAALTRLAVPGTAWTSAEFLAAGTLLASSRRTREALRDERRPQIARAVLADLAGRLVAQAAVERVIDRTIAPDGTVRDDASPLMRRVRRELRGAQGELVRMLERMMAGKKAPGEPTLIAPRGVVTRRSTDVLASEDPVVNRAAAYIREHGGRGLQVPDVAAHVNMSRASLEPCA